MTGDIFLLERDGATPMRENGLRSEKPPAAMKRG